MSCNTTGTADATVQLRDQLVVGSPWNIPLQYQRETTANTCTYSTFDISGATTITAEVRNFANDAVLIGPKALSSGASGADWENSLVVTNFTAMETGTIDASTNQYVWIRVRVDGEVYPDIRFSLIQ